MPSWDGGSDKCSANLKPNFLQPRFGLA